VKWFIAAAIVVVALLFCAAAAGDVEGAPDSVLWYGADPPAGLADVPAPALGALGGRLLAAPAYVWRDGCSPTAAGMVMGYWDLQYPTLVAGDVQAENQAALQMVASHRIEGGSARHYEDYSLPKDDASVQPDRSEPPAGDEHADDCVADFFQTSRSALGLGYGWTWGSAIPSGLVAYARSRGFIATTDRVGYDEAGWVAYCAEIDAGRPVMLVVDASGDGWCDHSMIGIGYRELDGVRDYACHNTWDRETHWYRWKAPTDGAAMGVGLFDTFSVVPLPRPAPPPHHHHAKAYPKKQPHRHHHGSW